MPSKKRRKEADESSEVQDEPRGKRLASETAAASVDASYESIDGYAIARSAKQQQRSQGIFLEGIQYGEIKPSSFATALEWLDPKPDERFIDLGSGTGKAVLTAAATVAFSTAVGVEIMQPLHDAAELALSKSPSLRAKSVRFVCADALAYPWTTEGYDCIFVSLTCFTDEMVEQIRTASEKLAVGTRLLVTSRPLESAWLKLLKRDTLPYGKGSLTFIAYEKV